MGDSKILKAGSLFVCATPIGNLSDISQRLITTLKKIDLIASEDTRVTSKLLSYLNIKKPLISLQKYNEEIKADKIIQEIKSGKNIALVSDAGTPNISDPGAHLLAKIYKEKIKVIPIPGPSSLTTLISIAPILANNFIFAGFFPKKTQNAFPFIKISKEQNIPLIFFESAQRIIKTLTYLEKIQPTAKIFLAKELTKLFENYYYQDIQSLTQELKSTHPKGEFCFIIKFTKESSKENNPDPQIIKNLQNQNFSNKQILYIAKNLLKYSKNKTYELLTKYAK